MKKHILIFLFITSIIATFSQTRYYVSITGSSIGDALSWSTACNDLQLVLNNASSGDTIWVAQGIYYPIRPSDSLHIIDSNNRENSFVLQKDLSLYGGFMGNETDLSQRNWENNTTILDGNIGVLNDSTDNVYHVVQVSADVLIDGFTIRNGHLNKTDSVGGPGIYKESGTLLLSNNTISHNSSKSRGTGIHSKNGTIILENNLITHNYHLDYYIQTKVDAIWLGDSNIIFINNTISFNNSYYTISIADSMMDNNVAMNGTIFFKNNFIHDNIGIGLFIGKGENIEIDGNSIYNNQGCGIRIGNGTTIQINDNYIYNNQTDSNNYISGWSGGIVIYNIKTLQIINNVIYGNSNNNYHSYFDYGGGGISVFANQGESLIANNHIYGNNNEYSYGYRYDYGGGGISIGSNNGKFLIINNLIYNNSTDGYGGGIYDWGLTDSGTIEITNNIIYNNKARYGGGFSIGGGYNYGSDYPSDYTSLGNTILTNNLIYNNHADNYGGGLYLSNNRHNPKILVNVTLTNNTLVDNYAAWQGGGIYTYYTTNNVHPVTNIRNSLLWGNTSGSNVKDDVKNTTMYISPTFSHCLVESLPVGNGIISNAYPLFVDTVNHDYRLQQCSPAINVGNNAYFSPDSFPDLSSITTDLDSNPRFFNHGIVDLGAYEYQADLSASLDNDTTICYGESASVVFSLTGASSWDVVYTKDGGITYDTLKNITTSPHIVKDTYTQTTTYKLYSVNNQICDNIFVSGQKTIIVIPIPVLDNVLSDDTLCSGEQTTAVAFTGAGQYQWVASGGVLGLPSGTRTGDFGIYKVENNSSSIQTSTITVTPQKTSGGVVCNGNPYTFNIIVYPPTAKPSITSNGFVFCEKLALEMEVTEENFVSYQWYKDGNPLSGQINKKYVISQLMPFHSGTYYVKAIGYYGEQLSNAITISVLADNMLVEKWNDVILVDNSLEDYIGYQWYKDSILIPGATNQFYQELGGLNGCYKVNLTLNSGRKEMTCERCIYNVTKSLSIYPNPARQGISVKVFLYDENKPYERLMKAMLYSAEGKLLQTKQTYSGSMEVNTFGLATGIYILKITTEDGLIHNEKIGVY